jgi:2-dehydro-3-deoxyphosphogluconate aldolase/(4S)-4-hydroxy-2-oxoglutarate aldolase
LHVKTVVKNASKSFMPLGFLVFKSRQFDPRRRGATRAVIRARANLDWSLPVSADAYSFMTLAPVIPVLTVRDAEDGVAQARALVAGGLPAIEVTLRTPKALEAISAIRDQVQGAFVGAGTILRAEQIKQACDAGARFLVSPGASPRLAEAAAAAPVPFLPGVATASEAIALMDLGFRYLKFFPA